MHGAHNSFHSRRTLLFFVLLSLAIGFGCGGGARSDRPDTPSNPVPRIAALSPMSATINDVGKRLVVQGSGFIPSSIVVWNGTRRTTTFFIDREQLEVTISLSDVATPGIAQINVLNPAPGGGLSATLGLNIQHPVPVLASVFPRGILLGGPDFMLTAHGLGFVRGSVVEWNGTSRATTYVSSTTLMATIT